MIASRKFDRLQATAKKYNDRKTSQGHLVPTQCNIRDQDEVKATVEVKIVHLLQAYFFNTYAVGTASVVAGKTSY